MERQVMSAAPSPHALNPDTLRELLSQLLQDGLTDDLIELVVSLFSRLSRDHDRLASRLRALRRGHPGGASEKSSSAQLMLLLSEAERTLQAEGSNEEVEDPAHGDEGDGDEEEEKKTRRKRRRTKPKPDVAHAVRVIVEVPVPPEERPCPTCGGERTCIGPEESRVLEFVPGHFEERIEKLEKLACGRCQGEIVQASASPRPIPGGRPGFGLLADIAVRKVIEHCPIHRLQQSYQRLGVTLSVNTMYDWWAATADQLALVAEVIHDQAMVSMVLQADDTGLNVLDREAPGGRVRGHMWAFLGDGEWLSYHYTPDWTAEEPCALLFEREGWLQVDAYAGYDRLFAGEGALATEVGCWSHARRYFVKALERGDHRAAYAIKLIKKLFRVEKVATADEVTPEERLARRKEHSQPILDKLRAWADDIVSRAPPKTPLGKALTYLANQWTALHRILEDGRLPLTTNDVERALRRIAVGRKNWMHCGSHEAARRASILYTVLCTAHLQGVDPAAYLRGLLRELARREWSKAAIARELLPNSRDWVALEKTAEQAGAEKSLAA